MALPRKSGLEGARGKSQVLVEFGTMTDAQTWYNSSEYNERLRTSTLTMRSTLLWSTASVPTSQWPDSQQERPLSPAL